MIKNVTICGTSRTLREIWISPQWLLAVSPSLHSWLGFFRLINTFRSSRNGHIISRNMFHKMLHILSLACAVMLTVAYFKKFPHSHLQNIILHRPYKQCVCTSIIDNHKKTGFAQRKHPVIRKHVFVPVSRRQHLSNHFGVIYRNISPWNPISHFNPRYLNLFNSSGCSQSNWETHLKEIFGCIHRSELA